LVSPFSDYFANTMEEICEHITNLCSEEGDKIIYAYHFQPDHDMHDFGVSNDHIKQMMSDFNNQLEILCDSLSDTLFILTADHGMIDVIMHNVEDYPQINNMLKRHICIEPRCCSFYIKDEYMIDFSKEFINIFGDKFKLFTHEEFLACEFFGIGKPHQKVDDFVGDFVAVAISDVALWYRDCNGDYNNFKGAHAGLTKEEMIVPLIIISKK